MARILLAEDEDSLRELVARALRQDGHEVVANGDGAAALDTLVREDGRYDSSPTSACRSWTASRWRSPPAATIRRCRSC
jgi:CheY-like chemotaxis protein